MTEKKLKKGGGLVVPDFRVYVCAAVTQTVWIWYMDKQIDQWNSIKVQKLTHKYMFIYKDTKGIKWLKKIFQQIVWKQLSIQMEKNLFLI